MLKNPPLLLIQMIQILIVDILTAAGANSRSMFGTMAKDKPKPSGPISYRPAPDVAKALREFRESLEVTPGMNAIIDRAVRIYLRSQGFDVAEKATDETDE
jgi:hypothetical protein